MDVKNTELPNAAPAPTPEEALFNALQAHGWTRLDFDNPRTYGPKGGLQYPTFEHEGMRLGLGAGRTLDVHYGVVVVEPGAPDDVLVAALLVDKDVRRQGRGRATMRLLTALADELKITLYIEPEPLEKWGAPRADLAKFYVSCGFVARDESARAFVRPPQTPGAMAAMAPVTA